jgi:hypothetical protein
MKLEVQSATHSDRVDGVRPGLGRSAWASHFQLKRQILIGTTVSLVRSRHESAGDARPASTLRYIDRDRGHEAPRGGRWTAGAKSVWLELLRREHKESPTYRARRPSAIERSAYPFLATWNTSGSCETTRADMLCGAGRTLREVVNTHRNCRAFSDARAPSAFLARQKGISISDVMKAERDVEYDRHPERRLAPEKK